MSPGIWVGRELLWLEGRWKVGSGQIALSVRLLLGMESWERRDLMDGQSGCRAEKGWRTRRDAGDDVCVCWSLSCALLFVTPWTVAHQAPLSWGLSRQDY